MPEQYRHEKQTVLPHGGKLGAFARVEMVKIRVHRCTPPFFYDSASGGRPAVRARAMTPAELAGRERVVGYRSQRR